MRDKRKSRRFAEPKFESRRCFRIAVDNKAAKAAAYWARQVELGEGDARFDYGGVIGDAKSYTESHNLVVTEKACEHFLDGISQNSLFNPVVIGAGQYPVAKFKPKEVDDLWQAQIAKVAANGKTNSNAKGITITLTPPFKKLDDGAEFTHHEEWNLDEKTMLPSSYKMTYLSRGEAGDKRVVYDSQTIEWVEHQAGVFLPARIAQHKSFPVRSNADPKVITFGHRVTTYSLAWQTVNSPLDQRLGDSKNLANLEFIREACSFDRP